MSPDIAADAQPSTISVMLVDDHAIVRHGLKAYLGAAKGIEVVAEASDGREALETLARMEVLETLPDVLLVDLVMPRMDGEQVTVEATRRFPSVKVVVMTSFGDAGRIQALLHAGAAGYILKRSDTAQIENAIRAAHEKAVYLDPVAARTFTEAIVHRDTPDLTAREREVIRLVARGMNNDEIARTLVMSERTARTHVSNILIKFGLESRTQAALWAIRQGIAPVDSDS